jgi:hypothetical protein
MTTPTPPARKKPGPPPVAQNKLNAYGIDAVCSDIVNGESLRGIAGRLQVDPSTLIWWIEEDPQRSARARSARVLSARLWDQKAEEVIATAPDRFALEKARELAHHYRWRAKAIAPRDYGDRVTNEHTGAGGGPIALAAIDMKNLSDEELDNIQRLLAKASPPPSEA